jgi:protease-4
MTESSEQTIPDPQPRASGESQRDVWYKDQISRVMLAGIVEQRRNRRWGIFFKSLLFLYLGVLLVLLLPDLGESTAMVTAGNHTAVVNLRGVISEDSRANADDILAGLKQAFEDKRTAGVVLRVNSPGGSPVQSAIMYDEIRRLRELYPDTPLYAVIEDVGASGGYFVAVAADAIYANRSSVVGSIGVRASTFGFVDAIQKLGVERRLFTAGDQKASLDPFSPLEKNEVVHLENMLTSIHTHFIDVVEEGRGDRLQGDRSLLFSGEVWTGDDSLELGLVDGFGDIRYVAREIVGAEELVVFRASRDVFSRLLERVQTTFWGPLTNGSRIETRWQ